MKIVHLKTLVETQYGILDDKGNIISEFKAPVITLRKLEQESLHELSGLFKKQYDEAEKTLQNALAEEKKINDNKQNK